MDFGQIDRPSGVGWGGVGSGYFQYFLYSFGATNHSLYISSYFIPVILFLLFIIFRRKLLNFKISKQSSNERFLFFIIFTCIITLIFTLRTTGFSDTYYQLLSEDKDKLKRCSFILSISDAINFILCNEKYYEIKSIII